MRSIRLSYQILAVFVAVVVLALGISGWALTTLAQRIVADNVQQGHLELTRRIAAEIDLEMENLRPILYQLAETVGGSSMEPARTTVELDRYQARFPAISRAYVADLSGQQVARSDRQSMKSVATTYGFQVAREGHELISDIYFPHDGQGPMLTVYLPIAGEDKVIGVLVADVNFARVQAILEDLELTRSETVVIFAPNGRAVAHSRLAELVEFPALTDPAIIETLVQSPAGILESYTDELGRAVVGVHAPAGELGWGVVIQTPIGELASEVATLRRMMIGGVLIGVALAVLAGWLMARRLAQPIGQLAQAAGQIEAGNLETRSGLPHGQSELGQLARAFDEMAEALQVAATDNLQLYEQVQRHTIELEARITAATDEIRLRAEELAVLNELGKEITATLELDTILHTIAKDAIRLVGADKSLISLINIEKEKLVKVVGHGYSREQLDAHTFEEFQDGLSGWVLREKAPTLTADIQLDERNQGKALVSAQASADRSAAIAPLLTGDEIFGTLTVVNGRGKRLFTPADLNLVTMLAGQAAIAIQNARLYQAAQEADRLKSAFLASMSHELRTPLNSIIGFTGILLQGLVGPLNDEQIKQLGMVMNSARHLLDLINDVLDISKVEAGQLELASEPFDLRDAIETAVQTVTPLADKKGLPLLVELAPDMDQAQWVIVGDRRRVEQILINLLNNAIKFTQDGQVCVESRVSDGWLVTRVIDTGIGIEMEDVDKLFKPFRQIDTGMARLHEGTGLGLSICKQLVEMMGGEIWVESEWGIGSTFTFTLPVQT